MRVGPAFVKIGKAILYPVDELDAWEKKNMVSCRASGRPTVTVSDQSITIHHALPSPLAAPTRTARFEN
jgi:hypothetical protein